MDRRKFLSVIGTGATLAPAISLGSAARSRRFDPTEQSITMLSAALAAGTVTSEELVGAYLERIERFDRHGPEHRSVLAVNPAVLDAARSLDAERRAGRLRGPLHGIPILLKDNIESMDPMPTTAEAFVKTFERDYVYVNDRPDAKTVLAQLPGWFEDYNENHPLKGLRMKSPREFIRSFQPAASGLMGATPDRISAVVRWTFLSHFLKFGNGKRYAHHKKSENQNRAN